MGYRLQEIVTGVGMTLASTVATMKSAMTILPWSVGGKVDVLCWMTPIIAWQTVKQFTGR